MISRLMTNNCIKKCKHKNFIVDILGKFPVFQCSRVLDAPNAPVKLSVEGSTDTSVSLVWKPPASDGGRAVKGYEIEWKMPTSSK